MLVADTGSPGSRRGLGSGSRVIKWGAGTLLPGRKVNRNRKEILLCSAASRGVSTHPTRAQPPLLSGGPNCWTFDSGLGGLTGHRLAGWYRGECRLQGRGSGAGQVTTANCVLLPKAGPRGRFERKGTRSGQILPGICRPGELPPHSDFPAGGGTFSSSRHAQPKLAAEPVFMPCLPRCNLELPAPALCGLGAAGVEARGDPGRKRTPDRTMRVLRGLVGGPSPGPFLSRAPCPRGSSAHAGKPKNLESLGSVLRASG